MEPDLSETETRILQMLARSDQFSTTPLRSRIVEQVPDLEFLPHGVPDGFVMGQQEFIDSLHKLRHHGYVDADETVHAYDSSEYIVSWKTTAKGRLYLQAQQRLAHSDSSI